jgi:hypothetical protein
MAHWYGVSRRMNNPLGWAYHATLRRHRIPEAQGRSVIRWDWRDLPPLPADGDAARWFAADRQRAMIAYRYQRERASA